MIYRIDVRTIPQASQGQTGADPVGQAIRHQIQEFAGEIGSVFTSRIFLLDTDAPQEDVQRIARELLADPVVEQAELVSTPPDDSGKSRIEIHLKPGVMDPVADSTEMAIRDMGLAVREVRTGRAYVIEGSIPRAELEKIASRVLANGVIESVHFDAYIPTAFQRGQTYQFKLNHVGIRELSDDQLRKLSRDGHLFLSLAEMKAIQDYFRGQNREPTDIELETLAQTWSEHCVHKTLKSAVDIEVKDASGRTVATRRYDNLIKETIFKSTMELTDNGKDTSFCLSVFADNAGVIVFDDRDAVCFKVETHNHPSAIEPYGGSATGIGGCIRDILGTGLSAKPIANTDTFCVAPPDTTDLPGGVIHPKRILQQVVAGVRDYGNRMGIPTVNGAVYFDRNYIGNPLVFAGCVGLIPRDKIHKEARKGDAIVVMGGRTGRDGIHGATFSSAELTDTHADEFSHAVQIGNAITQKKMADVILQARDRGLFSAVTDCGAGGLSSAVGEMGEKIGATVDLDKVPLKYEGLRYDEIWISEAQERMVLAVPQQHVEELLKLSHDEDVESTVFGTFGTDNRELILNYDHNEVGRISMHFLHDGIPMPTRKAVVHQRDEGVPAAQSASESGATADAAVRHKLLRLLAHPNIASKHWIIRQYDHEVQGGSVVKPLIGPQQIGPSDGAVIRPKLDGFRGVALGAGLAPWIEDPYEMALAAIDEAVRNVVSVGADPSRIAILDNFCWPSVDDEQTMGTLVRACEACYDAAKAYGIPFISGKDSLHNQFTLQETGEVIRIPRTLLISAIGVIDDVRKCVTMDLKQPDNHLYLIRPSASSNPDLATVAAVHGVVARAIREGLIASCHDVGEGGWLTAAAEMAIASGLGLAISIHAGGNEQPFFTEERGAYLAEVPGDRLRELQELARNHGIFFEPRARVLANPRFILSSPREIVDEISVDELTKAWRGTLDW